MCHDPLHHIPDVDRFKVGDVVRLKSGGPEMTVSAVGKHHFPWQDEDHQPPQHCSVHWVQDGVARYYIFSSELLMPARAPEPTIATQDLRSEAQLKLVADEDDEMARKIRETVNVLNSLRVAARDRAMEFEIEEKSSSKLMFVTITKHF